MAVKHWRDDKAAGSRLAAHRLTALLSVDLEGSKNISAIGAIRTDRSATFAWRGKNDGLRSALAALDEFSEGASYLIGHNIIAHDLELLARRAPDLELLDLPALLSSWPGSEHCAPPNSRTPEVPCSCIS